MATMALGSMPSFANNLYIIKKYYWQISQIFQLIFGKFQAFPKMPGDFLNILLLESEEYDILINSVDVFNIKGLMFIIWYAWFSFNGLFFCFWDPINIKTELNSTAVKIPKNCSVFYLKNDRVDRGEGGHAAMNPAISCSNPGS